MKYLQLSEGVYMFGNGGINRFEPLPTEFGFGTIKDNEFKTVLYSNSGKITVVKNTVDEILKMLDTD